MQYFAAALDEHGDVAQLLVTVRNGKTTQKWTGKVYASAEEMFGDLERLNCVPRKLKTRQR